MADDKKLIKVVFRYDDGTSKFIETEELDRWIGFNRQVAIFCQIHNNNPDWSQVNWEWESIDTLNVPDEIDDNVKTAMD